MKIIILAGGGGTRLFPLSRQRRPKQFLAIDHDASLFRETIDRFLPMVRPADIVVVTNGAYVHHVQTELQNSGAWEAHIVVEPQARNTAPAIALAAIYCLDKLGVAEDEVLFISPADHIIRPVPALRDAIKRAEAFAGQGHIVTFGIHPTKPETGFGYIETGEDMGGALRTTAFKEKPDAATAKAYLMDGNHYWNSGMFAFRVDCYLQELSRYAPDISGHLAKTYEETAANFHEMPDISVDYAIAEHSRQGVMIPLDLYWNDVGSWDAIYDVLDKDAEGNAIRGDAIAMDCQDSLIFGQKRLIAGIGLRDIMVIEADDVILVAQRGVSQKVKALVSALQQRGRKEVVEHTSTIQAEKPGKDPIGH